MRAIWGRAMQKLPKLSLFPWRWALHWLVVPCLVPIMLWPIGGPSMVHEIISAGCLGLVFSQIPSPFWKRISAIALTIAVSAAYLSHNFNLDVMNMSFLPKFLSEANWYVSSDYLMLIALLAVSIWCAVKLAPEVPRFHHVGSWLLGIVAVTGIAGFDYFATIAHGENSRMPDLSEPFHSATGDTDLVAQAGQRHNVVLVLVESLGVPQFDPGRALFDADWDRKEWRKTYDVSHGKVEYFGSTTNAELRELCGAWGSYANFNFEKANCLPEKLKAAGYDTTAIHSFKGDFFDREKWWPRLGFNREVFQSQLEAQGVRDCGGVFPGACDVDIPARIDAALKSGGKPKFVYWLTLNSHLPVLEDDTLGTNDCTYGGKAMTDLSLRLCRLFVVHHNLSEALNKLIMDPALPPTDFLIVGDHMPPYYQRYARERFDQEHVPWILLRARDKGLPARHPAT